MKKFTAGRIVILLCLAMTISCVKKLKGDEGAINSGDIIVSNAGSDAVLLFDSEGKFKKVLFSLDTATGEAVTGITLNYVTDQILIAVDGVDRIVAVDRDDLEVHDFIVNVQLTGTIRGITQLATGDILVTETSNVERFDSLGNRLINDAVTGSGVWPKALQTTVSDISAKGNGGFVHCSTGTDVVRTYNAAGTQVASVVSGIAATTDVIACVSDSTDTAVYAAFSGTTDTVRKLDPTSLATVWSFSNLTYLSTPAGMAVTNDGHILVLDSALNHVVKISDSGNFVGVMQGSDVDIDDMLSSPQFIYVMP